MSPNPALLTWPRPTGLSAWTPAAITDLELWLDAADTASITSSGGLVSQWNDKSGNARHVTQSTDANKPSTGVETLGGLNALTFDGNDSLRTSNGAYQPTSMSVFVVASTTTVGGGHAWAVLWPHHPTGWSNPWVRHALARWTTAVRGFIETSTTTSATSVLATNTPIQFGFTSDDAKVYKDGTVLATGTSGLVGTYPNTVPVIIGAASNNGEGWSGPIAEVVVVDGTIGSGDREKLEGYLAHKWGIAAGLPGGHPYKSSPP